MIETFDTILDEIDIIANNESNNTLINTKIAIDNLNSNLIAPHTILPTQMQNELIFVKMKYIQDTINKINQNFTQVE